MEDAASVGVGHRVADVDESAEQLAQGERAFAGLRVGPSSPMEPRDRLLQAFPPDEPHRVVGTAPPIDTQAVHGDHARVFEPAGDLGLEFEAGAAVAVARVLLLNQLQRDFPVQLLVASDEHLAQPSPGKWPEHVEPLDTGVFGDETDRFGLIGRDVRRVETTEKGKAGIQLRVGDVFGAPRGPSHATRPTPGSVRRRRRDAPGACGSAAPAGRARRWPGPLVRPGSGRAASTCRGPTR